MAQEKNYQGTEIDLLELFNILWLRKYLIIGITSLFAIVAVIYFSSLPPLYQAKAVIEIGKYNNNNIDFYKSDDFNKDFALDGSFSFADFSSNNKVIIDSAPELSKKLNILFIDSVKNKKDLDAVITSISSAIGVLGFIDIISTGISNELATNEITKVVTYIKNKHQIIMDDVRERRKLEIENLQSRINYITNQEIKFLDQKIEAQQGNLYNYRKQLNKLAVSIDEISKTDPALTALRLMEKRDILTFIAELNLQLIDMRDKKFTLETTIIDNLNSRKKLVELMLLPHNYQNSEIIGGIITNKYPVQTKKKYIVALSLFTGLIFSIFLVFIMNAYKSKDDKVIA